MIYPKAATVVARASKSYLCTVCKPAYVLLTEEVHEPTSVSIKALIQVCKIRLKVVTSEKIGGSGVILTLGTWYGGVVMGVRLPFNEAAILYRHFNSAPLQKQNIIVFAANNSRCCECHVAPTIIL